MSNTFTVTSNNNYQNGSPDGELTLTLRLRGANESDYNDIHNGNSSNKNSAYVEFDLPPAAKRFLDAILGTGGNGSKMSEADAANTISQFQQDNKTGRLKPSQLQEMANGYFTGKDGKTTRVPDNVQQAAQIMMANGGELFKKVESATDGKYDGELGEGDAANAIKKGRISDKPSGGGQDFSGLLLNFLMSALMNGSLSKHQPDDYDAAKTINQFQKDNDIGLLSIKQMQELANGYHTDKNGNTKKVSSDVQQAAQAFLDNDAELFKRLESATDGKFDGQLGQGDFGQALSKGRLSPSSQSNGDWSNNGSITIDIGGSNGVNFGNDQNSGKPMSDKDAAFTFQDFQKNNGLDLTSPQEMKKIADTGYFTGKDGKEHKADPEVQKAAQTYMANGGELYKRVESATDGKNDGMLGRGDPDNALKKGRLDGTGNGNGYNNGNGNNPGNVNGNNGQNNGKPMNDKDAVFTMKDFMKNEGIDLISSGGMKKIADTGYYTGKDGKEHKADPEVQKAAQTYMANGGELFKRIESANTGKYDGLLGQLDPDKAVEKGRLDGTGNGNGYNNGNGNNPGNVNGSNGQNNGKPMNDKDAVFTMKDFMKNEGIDLISSGGMKKIADTGYFMGKDGKEHKADPEVQKAAQTYMANGGELFKRIESANTGEYDGLLGQLDPDKAVEKGRLDGTSNGNGNNPGNVNGSNGQNNGKPMNDKDAVFTMKDFMKNEGIDLISSGGMKKIADTGYFMGKDGKEHKVDPEVQKAAQTYMANGGELFKRIESANTGEYDGLLGQVDPDKAVEKGRL
ncbi:hypothetical protein [Herbaspirillum chlorophenolicum]|uniref:hypothetical protein n=1 Tax=Herbaspirillum chlorophenolicum TaxID=211589 RepID=UPI00067AB7C4|nr:hypothetical protein [Herbaspirillum chlorophenolicum]